jgi:type I restriction enzyme S subunit
LDKEIFLNEFGHLAQGPDGVKKLRDLILQLAVQGKLVEQDPNDEPASVLLEKIKVEKERLFQNGFLKKSELKPYAISDDTLYSNNANWVAVPLTWVTAIISPGSKKVKTSELLERGKYPVVDQGKSHIAGFTNDESKMIEIEHALVVFGDHTRAIKYIDFNFCPGADGTKLLSPITISPRFYYTVLSSFDLSSRGYGRHFKLLKEQHIPLPPLAEQKRIVAKVDELMALCDELEASQETNVTLKRDCVASTLHHLSEASDKDEIKSNWSIAENNFGKWFDDLETVKNLRATILQLAVQGKLVEQDPKDESANVLLERIKKNHQSSKTKKRKPLVSFEGLSELKRETVTSWEWVQLDEIANIVRGGSPRPAGDKRFYDGEIPFLKVADITRKSGKYVEGYNFTIKEAGLKKTRYIDERTVLLSNSGATLGIPAICDFPTTFNDGVAAFVELDPAIYDEYLYLCLKNLSRWFLEIASRGQGQPNLNTDIIKCTWIPLPPLEEQKRIVAKVDELMALCDELETQILSSQTLNQTLMASLCHHMTVN